MDKVQKILSEIATRKLCTMDEHMAFYNDKAKEDYRFLSEMEELINTLQKEPISEDLDLGCGVIWKGEESTSEQNLSNVERTIKNWKEDLEESAEMFIDSLIPTEVDTVTPFAAEYVIELLNKAIEFGANWQKEQILDCNTTLQRTFELGKQEIKQQMMAEAVDAVVKIDAGGYPYVDRTIELYDYDKDIPLAKKGDKYKVILIKED